MAEDNVQVRVGQLWRRRRDGRAFIPAFRLGDGSWLNVDGIRRTVAELRTKYLQIPIDDGPPLLI